MYQTQNADFVNVAVGNVNETLGDGIWGSIPPTSGRVEDELDGWVAKCAQDSVPSESRGEVYLLGLQEVPGCSRRFRPDPV